MGWEVRLVHHRNLNREIAVSNLTTDISKLGEFGLPTQPVSFG